MVPQGDSVKLTCPIFGQPTPIITWSKGSETITDYAWTRFSLDKKSLKISQAEYDDTGIYICKGTNGYGSNEVRIDLFVIGEYLLTLCFHMAGHPYITSSKRLDSWYYTLLKFELVFLKSILKKENDMEQSLKLIRKKYWNGKVEVFLGGHKHLKKFSS